MPAYHARMSLDDSPIHAVVFDMDGVICDSEPFLRAATQEMFRQRYQADVAEAEFLPFTGAGDDRFILGPGESRGLAMNLADDKALVYQLYLRQIRGRLRSVAGVGEFIQRCRRAQLKLAVASAGDAVRVRGNLRELGFGELTFHSLITAGDVDRKKPDPAAFQLAMHRLGVKPRFTLVIEDAIHGVTAACRAECRSLGMTSTFTADQLRDAGAAWTAPDFTELPGDLSKLLFNAPPPRR